MCVCLQVICRRLFAHRLPGFSGLLRDPPTSVSKELTSALEQCTLSSSSPQPHININIMNTLLTILHQSLDHNTVPK